MTPAPAAYPAHYGDLRANATQWWALQRARVRLTLTAGAARRAGWGTPEDHLSVGLAAIKKAERAAARATMRALPAVYPVAAQLVAVTNGLGPAVALYLGLVPPLLRLEDFPGFPCPAALWAYSGLSPERRKHCDRRARMIAIAYIATPAILRGAEFRKLYAARRAATVSREWTKMHLHRDAIRYVAKRILRGLWLCRLPVDPPKQVLSAQLAFTAVGALPSAPESDVQPFEELAPSTSLSAPESDVIPDAALTPNEVVSAPESHGSPVLFLRPNVRVSAPEPDRHPKAALVTRPLLSAPGPDSPPKAHLPTGLEVSAPEPR